MPKVLLSPSTSLYPLPVVLVSCAAEGKRPNLITLAWCGVICSEPPMLSVSVRPHRYSSPLLKAAGEFVLSLPDVDILRKVDACGMISGAEVDKFAHIGLTPLPATRVKAPLVAECPVNMECEVRQVLSLGTHDIFLSEILAVHADERVLGPGGGIDLARLQPFTYMLGEYWSLGQKVGFYGCSQRPE
jgi:flavin reductase (DIM6/NTAB) family NADH-FMN oxidoreductase RutF